MKITAHSDFSRLVIGAILCLVIAACTGDKVTPEIAGLWDQYVSAMGSADTAAVQALYAPESRPYVRLTPDRLALFDTARFTPLKAQRLDSYTLLTVAIDQPSGMDTADYYLVRQDDSLRFQLPLVLFAGKWPTVQLGNFRLHSDPARPDTSQIDMLRYARFLVRIDSLTGDTLQQPVDYFLCNDSAQVAELLGTNDRPWGTVGSAVVTAKQYEFAEMARAALLQRPVRYAFLHEGLVGFGEWERMRFYKQSIFQKNSRETIGKYLAQVTPDTLQLLLSWDPYQKAASDKRITTMQYFVATAVVNDLLEREDDARFRTLYQRSTDAASFSKAVKELYHLTPEQLIVELDEKYGV